MSFLSPFESLIEIGSGCTTVGKLKMNKLLSYFVQNLVFFHFRKISENLKNREKIKSGVWKNRVWRVTYELNEMGQYPLLINEYLK